MKKILAFLMVVVLAGSLLYAQTGYTREEAPVKLNLTVVEGVSLSRVISSYDPDGDVVTIVADPNTLPSGATISAAVLRTDGFIDPNLPPAPATAAWYTSILTWTPTYDQQGTYTIYLHAFDGKGGDTWVKVIIVVENKNRPPVL